MTGRPILVDIDTQFDFMDPQGALYVPGAEKLAPNLSALVAYGLLNELAHLATLDTHVENDPEFAAYGFPPHCLRGTPGWAKVPATRQHMPQPVALAGALRRRELMFEKATFDAHSNPGFGAAVAALAPSVAVVFGVATDYCVKAAVLGLRAAGHAVVVVSDAVAAVTPETGAAAVAEMEAAGARFLTTRETLALLDAEVAHVA